jgi:hypothetical protein
MMTAGKFAIGLLIAGSLSPASAQSFPEDVHCMLLSNIFAKGASDEKARNAAGQNLAFYIGRIEGRADPQAIATAMRAQASSIDPKTSGPAMDACGSRLARAAQPIQASGKMSLPHK